MKKHIKFASIGQYRQIVKEISLRSAYIKKDELGNPIYDSTLPKPIIKFKGTVKLHGTNSSLAYNPLDGYWIQSRSNIITPNKDNAGFAFFAESKKESFMRLFDKIKKHEGTNISPNDTIAIFGEWVGKKIQKNVAISEIEKTFFIFAVKIVPENGEDSYYTECEYLRDNENKLYNINDFKTYEIEIDFNHPELSQTKLCELTSEVEKQCPVGKYFGIDGTGEGIVWSASYKGHMIRFKVKGDKHAGKSKVKVLKPVDDVRIAKIHKLVNEITPTWRLDQMLVEACDLLNGGQINRKFLGDYIRLVIRDIIKEEITTISDAGFEPKEINKYISNVAKNYFFQREKDF